MTFIITLYVQEGIVMASDSRLTVSRLEQRGNQHVQICVPQSDANYKTFLAPVMWGSRHSGLRILTVSQ